MKNGISTPRRSDVAVRPVGGLGNVFHHLLTIAQLFLVALVVHLYTIEGPAFRRVFILAIVGFVINLTLPLRLRLPFFVLLSLAGTFLVFGVVDSFWLFVVGALLITVCRLPMSMKIRAALLAVAGAVLAASRAGLVPLPWSAAVWPILGSMFMFRLVVYLLSTKSDQNKNETKDSGEEKGEWWRAGAYFFMLPNLVFPLFPVIDFQTFRRAYYDHDERSIYEQGLLWIARGLVHLVLYRFVYHNVLNDPADVLRLGDLIQFMLGTFLLYLRVSGQFHLVVGLLHLFGFRLPETHKLYYLAHSFTELWRRINIYWTDFMMKVVFYPTYFKVKRLGPSKALVVSTIAVFLTTWILHSYQWFWLRGGFPITAQDIFFWGILGGLVVYGALRESKAVKTAAARARGWSWHKGLQATVTFSCFCLLWSLWSTESVTQWLWMFGAATDVDPEGVFLLVGTFATIFVLGGRDWNASGNATGWVVALSTPRVRTAVPLVLLVVAASPAIHARVPEQVATTLASLQSTSLNARDAALQHRGYYEQLDARATIVGQEALAVVDARRENWKEPAAVGILNERNDLISRDLIPLRHIQWNGNTFSTNQWGMRDREYTLEKPAGTLRIALMGPSHVMGNGVSDGETFENLVEERLNREYRNGKYTHFEILNFGVDGYTMNQQVALMEDRVFDFAPDIIIVTHYHRIRVMTERYLQKVIWANAAIPPGPLQALLTQAGLNDIDRGRVPVPFATVRKAVRLVGIDPRMPSGESGTRVRWIADEALQESFRRFNEVTRSKDVQPMVLTLNAVIDDEPPEPTHLALFNQLHLPLLNLWHIYPEAERAALRVAPWDDHPNAGGHRLIADRLYEQLVSFLESDTLEGTQRTLH